MKQTTLKLTLLALMCVLFALDMQAAQPLTFVPNMIVSQDGTGDCTSIQEAINAAPDNMQGKRFVIYVKNGLYNREKLIIPETKRNLTIIGESREQTVISYHMHDTPSPDTGNKGPYESWKLWKHDPMLVRTSATLTILADNVHLENLTVQNTAGPVGQALALTLRSNHLIFRNCNFLSYQDTIFLWSEGNLNYFENCLIAGRTDYIYGGAVAFFQACEIRSWGGGWITAPSTPKEQKYGYVFNECSLTYMNGSPRNGDDGEMVALGRPWHAYPKVAFLNTYMCKQIDPAGWPTKWFMDYSDTSKDLHLYEYNNVGPGADMAKRSKWAGLRALTEKEARQYTREAVLGDVASWE